MLYIISTPIGNLKDITLRALEALKECDYILCEDTRHSQILLKHYELSKELVSFHKFNETRRLDAILADLREGKIIGLLSDAGTPGVCDPGSELIQACCQENLPMTAFPGPAAFLLALTLTGLSATPFQFLGFIPKKTKEVKELLGKTLSYLGTSIFYETPHRIEATLKALNTLAPTLTLYIARELTKKFEQVLKGTAQELLEHFAKEAPRGEMVFLFHITEETLLCEDLPEISYKEQVDELLKKGYSTKQAITEVARVRKISKKIIYREVHDL